MVWNLADMANLPKIITILGVTASGKTSLALKLAREFDGEIVSADSRQIYQEFNIGTAKPAGQWKDGVFVVDGIPHHLIDYIAPTADFTLADYQTAAKEKTSDILRRGRLPFLVGGTALYLKAILENWSIPEVAPDAALRRELESKSTSKLYQELSEKDAEAATITGSQNKRRIIRALEVIHKTGRRFSDQRKAGQPVFDSLKLGLKISKDELRKRVMERTEEMFKNKLAEEVRSLSQKYGWRVLPMQSIGYREFQDYFDRKKTLAETRELIVKNTLAYTRRQMTWFKKDKSIRWIESEKESSDLIKKFLFGK